MLPSPMLLCLGTVTLVLPCDRASLRAVFCTVHCSDLLLYWVFLCCNGLLGGDAALLPGGTLF